MEEDIYPGNGATSPERDVLEVLPDRSREYAAEDVYPAAPKDLEPVVMGVTAIDESHHSSPE